MAGMMMFDNAGTFNKGYANGLAGLAFNSQGEQRQGALAKLAGVDAGAAYKLKAEFDDQDKADFAEFSKVMLSVPDEVKPQVYAKGVQRFGHKFQAMGFEPPQDYTQAMPLFEQAAGNGAIDNVQSTFISPEGTLGYLSRGGRVTNTGQKVSDKFSPMVDPVTGQVSGYSGRGNVLAPTSTAPTGGNRQVMMDAPVSEPDDVVANAEIQRRLEGGLPVNFKVVNGQIVDVPVNGSQARMGVKPAEPKAQTRAMSAQEIASYGLPAGTSATIDSNGSVNVLNKPAVEPKKQADANVVKQAAQLPSLLRRIQRVTDASGKLGFAGIDGGPIDQVALKYSPSGQELESAVGQLRAMLLPFVRVPGVGSQSDLEARLDSLQYPDASQPPAVRKRNIDELNAFVKDLQDVYTTMIKGGTPSAPASDDDALINKYLGQ